ncbi:MAG: NAD-dependent epimerase/dehydratase family protein [Bacteroidetes bacterium]|nr:NAD-dependent epimerase/dehydratase family protein [Bacteroidota bacterium]MBU1719759.1 NAD-dependent epimerase/dehydratase family protein [Bacteroidota bacterium]
MVHYLVTGGAGFIGSHLCERLLAENHQVTCFDNFDPFYSSEIKKQNISFCLRHPIFSLIEGDILDGESLRKLPHSIDSVVHIAAKAGVVPSIIDPEAYLRVNVLGTQNMLEFARNRQIRQFIFASSSSVYGENPERPWSEESLVLNPVNPYASSKICAELLGHVYSHLYNIRFIALRFFTVFGPRQRPDLAIHKFTDLISQGRPVPMRGDGSSSRDYTYIDDIIEGIIAAMKYETTNFEIFNLGNNKPVALHELIDLLGTKIGKQPLIEKLPMSPGEVETTYADISKSAKLLGYHPATTFDMGLDSFIDWYKGK